MHGMLDWAELGRVDLDQQAASLHLRWRQDDALKRANGAPRVPIPYAPTLQDESCVTAAHIVAAARAMCR